MATDKKIKLNGVDDWKAFDNGFIARADAAHLWNEKINPDNVDANGISQLKPFMTEPEEPDPTTYDKRIMPGQATPANSTRSSSTVATSAEQLDPQGRPKNANEMTLESRTAYNSDYAKYVNRLARYREEDRTSRSSRRGFSTASATTWSTQLALPAKDSTSGTRNCVSKWEPPRPKSARWRESVTERQSSH